MNDFDTVFPFVAPFLFIGMWWFIMRILSYMSGWTQLAARFHHPEKFQGKCNYFQSAKMKAVNFSGILIIGTNNTGLYLKPMILFRLFHKPLLIPWKEIHASSFKKFMFDGYCLTFKSCPGITLLVYDRTFEKIVEYLKV